MFKKIATIFKLNSLILTFYLLFIWVTFIFCYYSQDISMLFFYATISFLPLYFLVSFVLKQLKNLSFSAKKPTGIKKIIIAYSIFTAITLCCSLFLYIGFRPGSFSTDTFVQIEQALSGDYNDWHPVLHTLLFFSLPIKLTNSISSIIPFQLMLFSLVMGYMGMILYKYVDIKYILVAYAYILLNPYILFTILYPWKDVGFSLFALFTMMMAVDIYFSPHTHEKHWWLNIILGITLAVTSILRHNGILFTLPLLVALFFYIKKKNWLIILIAFLMIFFLIRVPLYHMLNVEKPGERVIETSGLPLTIIGNVVKETPENLDAEMHEYVYSIATQEQWSSFYHCGDFNTIKWQNINTEAIESAGTLQTLKIMVKCFIRSPQASLKALFTLTDIVYGLELGESYSIGYAIVSNDYGIIPTGNTKIFDFMQKYYQLTTTSILRYLMTIGFSVLAMLSAILATTNFKRKTDLKKGLLYLPILFYNLGTMLLLTGCDNRFFLVSFFICPIIVILALTNKNTL